LPLLPSPRLRRLLLLLGGLALVHVVELWRHGHPLAAAVTLLGGVGSWAWQRARQPRARRPRRLLVTADGRVFLQLGDGAVEQASVGSASLRLGRSLLLVLRCGKRRHRLLLGPDNLARGQLAALQRRLPRGTGG
jgi:hypothetical protein